MINWPKTTLIHTKITKMSSCSGKKNRRPPPAPSPSDISLQILEQEVKHAVKSFPPGSAGGPNCLRPQHTADLGSCRDNGPSLLIVIIAFVNMLLKGQCATEVIPFLFGANLTALTQQSWNLSHSCWLLLASFIS